MRRREKNVPRRKHLTTARHTLNATNLSYTLTSWISEAASLHDHIRRLEDVLRKNCPDINLQELSNGHSTALLGRPRNQPGQDSELLHSPIAHSFQESSHDTVENLDSNFSQGFNDLPPVDSSNTLLVPPTPTPIPRGDGGAHAMINASNREIAHEIGLIPLSAGVNKYVGPSSGFPFAKLVFARAEKASPGIIQSLARHDSSLESRSRSSFTVGPTDIPTSVDQALHLSRTYFDHVQPLYPFLHEHNHYKLINEVYSDITQSSSADKFQVTMVLAISSIILSKRVPIPYTGEGLCTTAMEYIDQIDLQSSAKGVQCLLLISMFTLHSPFLGINPWYLNYQCLAVALDLGLQRDVSVSNSVSPFEKEMRTRMFWVIYSIDRTIATTLGRPIGVRDEGCDLRVSLHFLIECFHVFMFPCFSNCYGWGQSGQPIRCFFVGRSLLWGCSFSIPFCPPLDSPTTGGLALLLDKRH